MGNLLKLLVCNNEKFGPQTQKHVKELVGHELNTALFPILFDQIKISVDKFFDSSGQVCKKLLLIDENYLKLWDGMYSMQPFDLGIMVCDI